MKLSLPLIIAGFLAVYFSGVYIIFYLKKSGKGSNQKKVAAVVEEELPLNNSINSKFMKPSKASSVGVAPNDELTEADLEKILGRFQKSNGEKLVPAAVLKFELEDEGYTKGQFMSQAEIDAELDGVFITNQDKTDEIAEPEDIIEFDESETYFGEFDEIDYGFNSAYVTFNSEGEYSVETTGGLTENFEAASLEKTADPLSRVESPVIASEGFKLAGTADDIFLPEEKVQPDLTFADSENALEKANNDQGFQEQKMSSELIFSESEEAPTLTRRPEGPLPELGAKVSAEITNNAPDSLGVVSGKAVPIKRLTATEALRLAPKNSLLERADFVPTQFKKKDFLPESKGIKVINQALVRPSVVPVKRSLERMSISGSIFRNFNLGPDEEVNQAAYLQEGQD